jgi:hypothetical protein
VTLPAGTAALSLQRLPAVLLRRQVFPSGMWSSASTASRLHPSRRTAHSDAFAALSAALWTLLCGASLRCGGYHPAIRSLGVSRSASVKSFVCGSVHLKTDRTRTPLSPWLCACSSIHDQKGSSCSVARSSKPLQCISCLLIHLAANLERSSTFGSTTSPQTQRRR